MEKRSLKELFYFVLSADENPKSSFKERSIRQRKKSRIVPPGSVGTDDVGRNGEKKGEKTLVEVNQSNSQVRTTRKRCDWLRRCGKTSVFTALQNNGTGFGRESEPVPFHSYTSTENGKLLIV